MAEPSITDWISALSAVAGVIVASVSAVLAYRAYIKEPEQQSEPEELATEDRGKKPKQFVVFSTKSQETSLLLADGGLECHLQGAIGKRKDGLQWRLKKDELNRILEEHDYSVDSGYRAKTGRFSIGRHRNWLYSKKLYPDPDYLKADIREILKRITAYRVD